jgi:hypothetical protein
MACIKDNVLHYKSEADSVTATDTEMRKSHYIRHRGKTAADIFAYFVPAL